MSIAPVVVLSLDERAHRIVGLLETCAIDVGTELLAAKREHPSEFMQWVHECLPWGIDKAERLMAVTKAFATCEPELRALLPAGWTVLFELSRLPTERLQQAVESGEVTPTMTLVDARELTAYHPDYHPPSPEIVAQLPPREPDRLRLTPDVVATELIRLPRGGLSTSIEELVREWLDGEPG